MAEEKSQEFDFEFDVCLSFAGEQRDYVEEVAQHLRAKGAPVTARDSTDR